MGTGALSRPIRVFEQSTRFGWLSILEQPISSDPFPGWLRWGIDEGRLRQFSISACFQLLLDQQVAIGLLLSLLRTGAPKPMFINFKKLPLRAHGRPMLPGEGQTLLPVLLAGFPRAGAYRSGLQLSCSLAAP